MMTRHTFLSLLHLRFFNVALFFGQCHWMGQIIHKYDHVQSLYKIVSKNPKKSVSKMETQLVSIICKF